MKKKFLKCISLAVTIATVMASTGFGTVAVADNLNLTNSTTSNKIASESAAILMESESLRSEYEKHFFMSDGSYTVATYNEPVHKLENGKWVEVDNTLVLKTDAAGATRYENKNGIANVSFASHFQNELVTISQADYSLTWGLSAISAATAGESTLTTQANSSLQPVSATVISQDVSHLDEEEQKTLADLSTSVIRYNDALAQDVDLEYVVLPSRVKESIILQSAQDISCYILTLYTQDLSARLLENREIEFYDAAGEVIFTMWAPYMYDSASSMSQNITVELRNIRAGQYLVKITPDATWLNDPSRVYPVVIDPDVTVNRAHANIIDNYVLEGSGVQNLNSSLMYIGNYGGNAARIFLRYATLPTLPDGATILNATQTFYFNAGTTTASTANAYKVTGGSWSSGTISWNNMPSADTLIASNISHNNCSNYTFNCTGAVQSWYSGSSNNGIMLRYTDETVNDFNCLYSADYSVESKRPLLSIRYDAPTQEIVWPVPGYYNISSEWGYRTYNNRVHTGIDIVCNRVTVLAATSGTVKVFYDDLAGYAADVRHSDTTFRTRYYHLTENSYLVSDGQYVTAGTPLALSGNTGDSTGPHLHFQIQWGRDLTKVYNPLAIYNDADDRRNLVNPNPMFILVDGIYVPNDAFDYTYTHSIYNCTDYRTCELHDWID